MRSVAAPRRLEGVVSRARLIATLLGDDFVAERMEEFGPARLNEA
jgi:hypothetical protein